MFRQIFLLLPVVLLLSLAAWAHAYHASIMELRYNPQKLQLEIALKLFSDDFEKALSVGQAKGISLDKSPKEQVNTLVTQLVRRSLEFSTKPGEVLPLTLVGIQHEHDSHWVYFTAKLPRPVPEVTLRHKLMLDVFPDQMNVVNLEANGQKQTLLFREGQEQQQLKW
ncbi:hypothetical protein HMJ29_02195 [Hymenobacter taeanensis]|uniref:Uncharacterized protein n=1 Tax=Hymenobacter taeanensis TaxID=2735321 RepID=A0A6M6BC99_9BACT|nr:MULTISPECIES: DUF6702 family protein [Hymenobacter]QJX45807.1 hypothetical protein HMJ29_02195 [Hymenobacter taeanensis]UOQ79651.1 hypothetical protein MUN83_12405 [Hymenobacter sp. 5414T-23]